MVMHLLQEHVQLVVGASLTPLLRLWDMSSEVVFTHIFIY